MVSHKSRSFSERSFLNLVKKARNRYKLFKKIIRKFFIIIQKKKFIAINIKKSGFTIHMINLSLDELKLVAESRNIRDYENKSKKDLIKAFSEPKPKIKIDIKKFEEIRKYFDELRHKFSKKEIEKYRKAFYDIENYKYLFTSEIKKAKK